MKRRIITTAIAAVIILMMGLGNVAYAKGISRQIHLTVRVVGVLSLNIGNDWLDATSNSPTAEAFSELKEHEIQINKLKRNDSMVWLFTKTE